MTIALFYRKIGIVDLMASAKVQKEIVKLAGFDHGRIGVEVLVYL